MQESFLHFIWQYQYFNRQTLQTSAGEPILMLAQGMYNRQDAGPDFKASRLQIGGLDWFGDVEIHVKASDWMRHQHQQDPAYNSVVLHVVWEDDVQVYRQDGTPVPQLVIRERVDARLIGEYTTLMKSPDPIPCAGQFSQVDNLQKVSMLDKALLQRLKRKSATILEWLEEAGGDWETVAWWLLASNFGFKKNNQLFLNLAKRLPLKVLAKHRQQPLQQEALLFGMAGFLQDVPAFDNPYLKRLHQEWAFLGLKYELAPRKLQRHQWKFLRMRPANFPTVRLAQLAAILQARHHIFSIFRDEESAKELTRLLRSPQSPYWQEHYDIGKVSKSKMTPLGLGSAQNLLINTAAPLLAAYGVYMDDESWIDRAMELLQQLPAESNFILREWKALGFSPHHAFDSQALIELYNEFCQPKKCLQCSIGLQLIKRKEGQC